MIYFCLIFAFHLFILLKIMEKKLINYPGSMLFILSSEFLKKKAGEGILKILSTTHDSVVCPGSAVGPTYFAKIDYDIVTNGSKTVKEYRTGRKRLDDSLIYSDFCKIQQFWHN